MAERLSPRWCGKPFTDADRNAGTAGTPPSSSPQLSGGDTRREGLAPAVSPLRAVLRVLLGLALRVLLGLLVLGGLLRRLLRRRPPDRSREWWGGAGRRRSGALLAAARRRAAQCALLAAGLRR